MLESLEIENFRGIKKLKIDNFKNINFFIGKANTSKTTIIETIYIVTMNHPMSIVLISHLRDMAKGDDVFSSLFYNYDINYSNIKFNYIIDEENNIININKDIKDNIISIDENEMNNIYKLLYTFSKNDKSYEYFINRKLKDKKYVFNLNKDINTDKNTINTDSLFINSRNAVSNLYANLILIFQNTEKKKEFKNIYTKIDNNIKDISFIGNSISVELKNLSHTINIKSMGKGFQTYISIIASMLTGKKYIIIDEIENGMHFESVKIMLENILSLSKKYGLQFFITTHNKELLEILNECLIEKDYKDMLSVYNLYYNKENNIDVINYSQENFSNLIENNNEMRD